jgi:hypothetical protein
MFGKYNGFVSKARGFCMHVFASVILTEDAKKKIFLKFLFQFKVVNYG